MRKDELLHLHQLMALIRQDFERRDLVSPQAFDDYDDLDVGPMTIYAAKGDHERAVQALATVLSSAVERGADERAVASP